MMRSAGGLPATTTWDVGTWFENPGVRATYRLCRYTPIAPPIFERLTA